MGLIVHADEDKKSNATYIISVARKLGCSIFLLPEDIIEVRLPILLLMRKHSSNNSGSNLGEC